ncbi:MAG: repressor LexA [Candidatus Wildermuthbacteria bacterium RIFCSPLOWO2_02_FULL_47_9c]|uniref:LexA repressor n=2 Tax=Parcubacteria group TaxID=1794811 RepID=A0A837IR62_9BACT|nr:MAG: LexA repressor [Candidatus Yanofskybacteria bacterium GW2011_GWC1_48_11]KKW03905.1 MAG: LexA repressor [Parcubacteria group bacterium GW2011_GWB1_49_12]KKW08533.1 MAG: LexA repressor [Parcubacteria group bacterium GW2011_GWA1_49_26]KKW14009.1 MAG: LexA repressor [Parcubacteria group bacterium GW2011_GWA2_50_10]OHA61255.1 MAG: repressor LexA [Candidatus Wildermuthbacteria bacterium GWA1_49_26]OHA65411.1 MAG: repressor LexA [Candidatus Wildermuthbacteria bacterium RIFCSPHIGHO2_01_FULL_50
MPTQKPTKKQREVLDFIKRFQKKHHYSPSLKEIAKHFGVSAPTIHQHVQALRKKGYVSAAKGEKRSVEAYEFGQSEIATIPLMGLIPAGGPIEAISNPEPIQVPKSMLSRTGRHYALEVRGRSMIEEGISDGDIVIIRDQPTVENGESAVAYLPEKNEVTLKKIYHEGDRIRLQPANKEMQSFYEKKVDIQGKVLGVIRKVK